MIKKAKVDDKLLDVVSPEEYAKHKNMYANTSTAIELEVKGKTYILPYRDIHADDRPGIYPDGSIQHIKFPTKENENNYLVDKLDVIDYSDTKSVQDLINKQKQLRELEGSILSDVDNVYVPDISSLDSPEMQLLKTALANKKCDPKKYEQRFGDNFLNDMRLFKGHSVTLKKLVSIAENFDIEVELKLRDKAEGIPNPMGEELSKVLTGGISDDN